MRTLSVYAVYVRTHCELRVYNPQDGQIVFEEEEVQHVVTIKMGFSRQYYS